MLSVPSGAENALPFSSPQWSEGVCVCVSLRGKQQQTHNCTASLLNGVENVPSILAGVSFRGKVEEENEKFKHGFPNEFTLVVRGKWVIVGYLIMRLFWEAFVFLNMFNCKAEYLTLKWLSSKSFRKNPFIIKHLSLHRVDRCPPLKCKFLSAVDVINAMQIKGRPSQWHNLGWNVSRPVCNINASSMTWYKLKLEGNVALNIKLQ